MRSYARIWVLGLLVGALLAGSAPVAQAGFGVEEKDFEAGTCKVESCLYSSTHEQFFTQSAGHPPFGITTFELNSEEVGLGQHKPQGAALKRIRVDVPAGLAANPEALEKCPIADFLAGNCEAKHPGSRVATNKLVAFAGPPLNVDLPETEAPVFNLEQPPGLPLDFGIEVAALKQHIFLEGHVAWSSDYHEYFEINEIPNEGEVGVVKVPLSVLKSKLIFKGTAGQGNFLTLPTACSTSTTSYVEVESWTGEISRTQTHTPVGVEGCEQDPFKPSAEVKPETAQSDQPDGATTEVKVPQHGGPTEINTADIKDARVTLPEEMTLNPAAAHGLQACTAGQIGIGTTNPVTCPPASKVGTVTIETDLPPGSLAGNVYLGNPGGGPITGPPYTIYLDAESVYGVSVRLKGLVNASPNTGRLEATFTENPQLPFSDLILKLNGGARAPLANPLVCQTAQVEALFTPFTGFGPAMSSSPFVTGGCPAPLPFALAQSTEDSSPNAGAYTSYRFSLGRADGQQYVSQVKTVLPAGLVGLIPSVALCGEPQAALGTCSNASEIGTATVAAGAGGEPYTFTGPVFLTGPYGGGPFGLSIAVPAVAGPFNLGTVVTRAAIDVDPTTARVSASSVLPTIVGGVPLRLKAISVAINRANFLLNPTNCGALATESALTSTFAATQSLSTPFAVGSCGALAFAPVFAAATNANTSKANGASLRTTINQGPNQANIRSVFVQLPHQLVTRLSTLQQACPEATFAANPFGCPAGSNVGSASATTPVLPGMMTGPAYLVSHGAAAFPDLDLVLEGSGVRVILVGNTSIRQGATSSTFAAIPDVPVSSFTLNLPMGPHSALTTNGSLCAGALVMPTTIVAQSGAQIKQNTKVSVAGCGGASARRGVRILHRKIIRHKLIITVQTFAAGRIRVSGKGLKTAYRRVARASKTTLRVPLSRGGIRALRRHHRLKVHVRVGFVPKLKGEPSSTAATAVRFRR